MKAKSSRHSIDQSFRALADPTRLRILALLQDGELCVCDLFTVLDVPQPKVSRHLAYLRKAGFLLGRKEGQWRYYRLAEPRDAVHEKLLECLECCLPEVPEIANDLKKLERTRRTKRCCQ